MFFSKNSTKLEKQWDRECILERNAAIADSTIQQHHSRRAERTLILVSILTLFFVLAEIVGGYLAHSLAIMTDAFHMLSDLSSFLISIMAIQLSRRSSTTRHSFGFQRAEVLGALSSILVIWVLTGVLLYMAVWRIIQHEYEVEPDTMMLTAGIGVLFNLLIGAMLHMRNGPTIFDAHGHSHSHHQKQSKNNEAIAENGSIGSEDTTVTSTPSVDHQNLNIRAAFIHVLGDLCQSIGVLIAAIIIKFTGFALADPICTFLFSILVLLTTIPIFGDTLTILMEACPRHIDHQKVFTDLMSLPSVVGVHSLRIWALKTNTLAATVHLELAKTEKCSADKVVALAQKKLTQGHRIRFATIQTHCVLMPENGGNGTEQFEKAEKF